MNVMPCILLTFLSTMVILAMYQASKLRVRLLQQSRPSDHNVKRKHNRTTLMLVSVVLFSVITVMPYDILIMVSVLNKDFHKEVYSNLDEFKDLIILLNSAVIFVLYCIMSKKFRDTFKNLFVVNFKCHKHSVT
ncbi:hypothetical protein DPMN_039870 [Dreissena polymorpha]|uniref:G-protein coupled receptors family 1 profile domain-containing protein n=1 Tax=Dreissena polymorpha TaxID=45954 RepID=A0A9D4CX11_DREPO|nr:hypothetical protein DPMN_039870 [Dreissena polymorpha]